MPPSRVQAGHLWAPPHIGSKCQADEAHRFNPAVCGYDIAAATLVRSNMSDTNGILLVSRYQSMLWRRQGRGARGIAASGFTPRIPASAPTTPPTRLITIPSA